MATSWLFFLSADGACSSPPLSWSCWPFTECTHNGGKRRNDDLVVVFLAPNLHLSWSPLYSIVLNAQAPSVPLWFVVCYSNSMHLILFHVAFILVLAIIRCKLWCVDLNGDSTLLQKQFIIFFRNWQIAICEQLTIVAQSLLTNVDECKLDRQELLSDDQLGWEAPNGRRHSGELFRYFRS